MTSYFIVEITFWLANTFVAYTFGALDHFVLSISLSWHELRQINNKVISLTAGLNWSSAIGCQTLYPRIHYKQFPTMCAWKTLIYSSHKHFPRRSLLYSGCETLEEFLNLAEINDVSTTTGDNGYVTIKPYACQHVLSPKLNIRNQGKLMLAELKWVVDIA